SGPIIVQSSVHLPDLHSFPTRRSSDLPTVTQAFSYAAAAGEGTYRFYTRAFDTAGNVELPPGAPDAQVQVLYDTTAPTTSDNSRSEEHKTELQSRFDVVCRLTLQKNMA